MRRIALVVLQLSLAGSAGAQRYAAVLHPVQLSAPDVVRSGRGSAAAPSLFDLPLWTAPVASAVLPGAGQALLHQQRVVAYLAVEGFVWLQYLKDLRDWRQQRTAYRDLAAQVARSPFTASPLVGNWAYYESMEHFLESGVYSVTGSTTNVQPESDESTYNGSQWLLARRLYWPNPSVPPPPQSAAYQQSLAFYESRAVRPEYRWSWRNAQLEQDLYRRSINKANDAVRRATSDLGVIIANHVLSSVDAFAALRLRVSSPARGEYQVGWQVGLPSWRR